MGKRTTDLPRYVRKHRTGFRAVLTVNGQKLRGPAFATAGEAAAWAEQQRAGREQRPVETMASTPTAPFAMWTLQDAFETLLAELRLTRRPATVLYYVNHWRTLGRNGFAPDRRPRSITRDDVLAYATRRRAAGVCDTTVWGKELPILSRVLDVAEREGLVARNVIRDGGPRPPRLRQRRFSAMATETIEDLLDRIRAWSGQVQHAARDADIVDLFFSTGIRLSEMARLRAADVNWDTGELRVDGKTDHRLMPLRIETLEILRRFARRAGNGPLIGSVDLIERAVSRWQKRLGEPRLHAHALRHSYATAMARANVNPYVLRDLLGHQNLEQTLRYYHTQSDVVRAAVAAIPRRPVPGAVQIEVAPQVEAAPKLALPAPDPVEAEHRYTSAPRRPPVLALSPASSRSSRGG